MFERFTEEARRAVVLAEEEARVLLHNWIGTEHLLLGVLHGDTAVAEALAPFGLTLERARQEVEARTKPTGEPTGHIPFTPNAKQAMERSLRESIRLGHRHIGSAHLLLGVLEVEKSLGATIVTEVSDDVEEVRQWLQDISGRRSGLVVETEVATVSAEIVGRRLPGRGIIQTMPFGSDHQRCAFCDRDLWEVEASVAGRGVAICSECVEAAAGVLRDAADAGAPTPDPLPLPPRVFGERPDDEAAEAVTAALRGAITTDLPPEERIASMEDGATLVPLIEQAGARYAGRVQLVIGAVRFVTEDHAQARYEIVLLDGPRVPFEGDVVHREGRWIVTRETIAWMIGRAGVHPPPPPEP